MRYLSQTVLSAALMSIPLAGSGCSTLHVKKTIPVPQLTSRMTGAANDKTRDAARREENRGNLDEAKRLYTSIHDANPKDAECCHRLGLIYAKLNRHGDAEVFFRQGYEITPDNPRLLADRGYSALMRKEYEQAEIWFEQSTRLDPHNHISLNDSSTMLNLAIVRAWLKKDDASLATFRLISDEAESRRNLAAIQIARGDQNLGLQNYELAQNLEQLTAPIVEARNKTALLPAPETVSTRGEDSQVPDLTSVPISNDQHAAADVVPAPTFAPNLATTSLVQSEEPTLEVPSQGKNEIILAPLASPSDSKAVLVSTCVHPIIAMASFPISVTAAGIDFPTSSPAVAESRSSVDMASIPKSAETSDDLVFELPTRRVSGESISNDSHSLSDVREVENLPEFETPGAKPPAVEAPEVERPVSWDEDVPIRLDQLTSGQNISDFCLVSLREDRRIVMGQREFSVEYHGQKYLFSSVESQQKFRAEPERYAPSAGGLDLVLFRNEREVVQGSLKFATWYRHSLYVFTTQQNRDVFQQTPGKYVVTQAKSPKSLESQE